MSFASVTQHGPMYYTINFDPLSKSMPLLKNVPPGALIVQHAKIDATLPGCPQVCVPPKLFVMGCYDCAEDFDVAAAAATPLLTVALTVANMPAAPVPPAPAAAPPAPPVDEPKGKRSKEPVLEEDGIVVA